MPYFKWIGTDCNDNMYVGNACMRSNGALEHSLAKDQITLIDVQGDVPWLFRRTITVKTKAEFFRQLSFLLNSGIFLDKAVGILAAQCKNKIFKKVLDDIHADIAHGVTLRTSFGHYPTIFGQLECAMVQAGQESGILSLSFTMLADYLETMQQFRAKIKQALLTPGITFIFFLAIALFIIIVMIPRFTELLAHFDQPLPDITQTLMHVHNVIVFRWPYLIISALGLVLVGKKLKNIFLRLCIKLPFIGRYISENHLFYFLQSCAILVQGKIPLAKALALLKQESKYAYEVISLDYIANCVQHGQTLHTALETKYNFISSDIIVLIALGHESGNLGFMLQRSAELIKARINRRLIIITSIIQPIFMIILGLLVLVLIIAIYLPIFSISYSVS